MSYNELYSSYDPLVGKKDAKDSIITIFGVPFDGTTTYRPGARFGPNAIRSAFLNIEAYSKRLDIDVEKVPLRDIGNLQRFGDEREMIDAVRKVTSEFWSKNERFCMLGGEHSITLGSYLSSPSDVAYIVFDAHFDLRDEFEGLRYSHASYLKRIIEKRDPSKIAHLGARAATKEEWALSKELALTIDSGSMESKDSERYDRFVKGLGKVYVSIDMDVLDPSYAPAVSNPEPGGISIHTLLDYIYKLEGLDILAFDIVELCPPYDNGASSTAAARLMNELIALVTLSKE